MSLVTAAMLVVLGTLPAHAPDLQVEAATAGGTGLPELADAVARALVASGARVVLGGPTSAPCEYCAKVVVTETRPGDWRVEVSQERHKATASLRLPTTSPLFDRARAIAIQARLLVTWETGEEPKSKEVAGRPAVRKPEAKPGGARALAPPEVATVAPVPAPVYERLPSASELVPAPSPPPAPEPAAPERRPEPAVASGAKPVERADSVARPEAKPERRIEPKPEARAEAKPPERDRVEKRSLPPAAVAEVSVGPKPQWPWIPTAIGVGAGIGAGICAVIARQNYNALSDQTRGYTDATKVRDDGKRWQLASFVLAGVAVAGVGTGIVGFATRPARRSPVSAAVSPIPGGGMVAITGGLP